MSDNLNIKDGTGLGVALASKDIGGVEFPWHLLADAAGADALGLAIESPGAYTLLGRLRALAAASRAATSAPLTGTQAAAGAASLGPFAPMLDRPIVLTLSGGWAGSVQLLRSNDGGATKLPVTIGGGVWAIFTGNANEPVWVETEAAASFYLASNLTTGGLTYRLAQ